MELFAKLVGPPIQAACQAKNVPRGVQEAGSDRVRSSSWMRVAMLESAGLERAHGLETNAARRSEERRAAFV